MIELIQKERDQQNAKKKEITRDSQYAGLRKPRQTDRSKIKPFAIIGKD